MRVDSSVENVIYSGIKIFLKAETSEKYAQTKLISATKHKHQKSQTRAGPRAKWLSSHTLLQQPRVLLVWILGADIALIIRPCGCGNPHATARRTHN